MATLTLIRRTGAFAAFRKENPRARKEMRKLVIIEQNATHSSAHCWQAVGASPVPSTASHMQASPAPPFAGLAFYFNS